MMIIHDLITDLWMNVVSMQNYGRDSDRPTWYGRPPLPVRLPLRLPHQLLQRPEISRLIQWLIFWPAGSLFWRGDHPHHHSLLAPGYGCHPPVLSPLIHPEARYVFLFLCTSVSSAYFLFPLFPCYPLFSIIAWRHHSFQVNQLVKCHVLPLWNLARRYRDIFFKILILFYFVIFVNSFIDCNIHLATSESWLLPGVEPHFWISAVYFEYKFSSHRFGIQHINRISLELIISVLMEILRQKLVVLHHLKVGRRDEISLQSPSEIFSFHTWI